MIELVTVELTNFRSFSHAVFEPLGVGQGMTAINGANGMGKSSVVHAIVWALYGITPDGVRVGALRRQGSEGDVEVKVTLRHDGQTVIVSRAIRGRNDTTVASIEVDGVEQTNVSSKTATNWIINRFGLDSEAFLTAFIVRQKELDSLVRARPAERRKTIERLAGIERMSKALELARAEARLAQKSYDALPPIQSAVVLEEQRNGLKAETTKFEADKSELDKKLEGLKSKLEAAKADLVNGRETIRRTSELENKIELEEDRLADLDVKVAEADKLAKLASNSDALLEEQATVDARIVEISDSLQADKARSQELSRALTSLERLKETISTLQSQKVSIEEEIKTANGKATAKSLESAKENLAAAQEEESTLTADKGAARGEWDRLKKAIETLTSHSHEDEGNAKCPTCNSDILDVEILLTSLNSSLNEVETRGKQINSQLVEVQERVNAVRSEISILESKQRASETLEEDLESVIEQIGLYESELVAAQENVDALDTSEIDVSALTEEYTSLVARQKELIGELAKLETAIEAKKALPDLKDSLVEKTRKFEELVAEFEEASADAAKYDLAELESEVEALEEEYSSTNETARELGSNIRINKNQIDSIESAIETIAIEEDRRKVMLAEVESKTAAATTLDEFRRDRLARLTPELSEVASDFVSRMTDGKYTSVMLDEDFTPILTDASGAERPVAWLSGGEESAVALALRVAIGEVLAGQRGGMLVLDEALTAQDASRRQSTMGAIRVLPRQIITINHVSEATDMVDLVAEVVASDEGGSTIMEVVPDNGKIGIVSDAAIDA